MPDIDEFAGLRFMERFRCLGGDCEDPCCGQWEIPVDEPHFQAMAAALGATAEGQAELARAVRRLPVVDQRPERVGDMALEGSGRCVMLEPDNLCSLHRRFGEEVLADTCATYPRSVARLGARLEMSGLTSCPEVVRLLLHPDAVDEVPFEGGRFARRKFAHEADDPAHGHLTEIRGLMLDLLRAPYPFAMRQMFLAALADRTAPHLPPGAAADAAGLAPALAMFRDPGVLDQLHGMLASLPLDEVFAVTVVLGVVEPKRWPRDRNFGRLAERITSRYAPARKKGALDPRLVWTAFRKRRDAVPPHLASRIDLQLQNYAINNVYQEWFTACPSLRDFVVLHLVQVALIRFLLISHPETSRACNEPASQGLARLDAAFVECVSYFSRAAHHSAGLGARIMRRLEEGGMQTAAHLCSLARL